MRRCRSRPSSRTFISRARTRSRRRYADPWPADGLSPSRRTELMADAIKAIVMPKWGLAMQEGMVAKWLVEQGAEIRSGEQILDIETSKIATVYESPFEGPLRRRLVGEGETVPVGALLGVVADPSVSDADLDASIAHSPQQLAAQPD